MAPAAMTAPAIQEHDDPIIGIVKTMREHGVPLDEIEAYVAKKRGAVGGQPTGHAGTPFVDAPEIALAKSTAKGHNGTPFVNATEQDETPDAIDKTLGVASSLVRDIPGGELAQAGLRSIARGQPFREARTDIRTAEDAAPAAARTAARVIGGGLSAAAIPGGPALQGARFGILSGLAQSDPDAGLNTRLHDAAIAGGIGAGGAVALPALGALAKSPKLAVARDVGMTALGSKGAALRLVKRGLAAVNQAAPEAAAAAPEAAPSLSGLQSPMESVADLVKSPTDASSVIGDIKPLATAGRHRTAVQFDHFAESMGQTKPQPASSFDGQMATLLKRARAAQPNEIGATYGDAEEAMGVAPHQQPDLEDLLRRSIAALGKKPPTP